MFTNERIEKYAFYPQSKKTIRYSLKGEEKKTFPLTGHKKKCQQIILRFFHPKKHTSAKVEYKYIDVYRKKGRMKNGGKIELKRTVQHQNTTLERQKKKTTRNEDESF